jgi:peroxiredoxin Q/BCP
VTPEATRTAPSFDLPDQDGKRHRLDDYRGHWVVLYFYPKDDTPGCTKEACSFRDAHAGLKDLGATVLGVSADDEKSHAKFANKFSLNFPLLADEGGQVARQYESFGEKTSFGRTFEGIYRNTFLIDPQGRIAREWRGVNPEEHVPEVEAALKEAQARGA